MTVELHDQENVIDGRTTLLWVPGCQLTYSQLNQEETKLWGKEACLYAKEILRLPFLFFISVRFHCLV